MLNNTQHCLSSIRNNYSHFSDKERLIANFILEHPDKVIHYTINQVAEELGIADSTVFRFCKRIGFKGFQSMKIALAAEVVDPINYINEKIKENDGIGVITEKIFRSNIKTIEDTLQILDERLIIKAVNIISGADKVHFFGSGGSAFVALDAYHKFIRTGINANANLDSHLQMMSASQMTDKDVAVLISHSGSTKDLLDISQVLKKSKVPIIAITNFAKSYLTERVGSNIHLNRIPVCRLVNQLAAHQLLNLIDEEIQHELYKRIKCLLQIIFNPLSSSAVALWHTLIHFNNLCGWKQEFSVAATQLQLKAGLKSTSFKRAREELQEGGWIQVKSLGANRAAVYHMISQQIQFEQNNPSETSYPTHSSNISSQQNSVDNTASTHPVDQSQNEEPPHPSNPIEMSTSDDKTVNRTDHNPDHTTVNNAAPCKDYITGHSMDHTTAPLFKQKNTKQNINKNQITTADAIRFYQDNFERVTPFISEDILEWINDMGEPLVLHAMKLSLEQGKTTWRYVKAILKAWDRKGITTLEAAKAEETAYHNRRTQKSQQGYKPHHAEVVPDWFTELKRQEHPENQVRHNTLRDHNQSRAEEEKELEELLAKYA